MRHREIWKVIVLGFITLGIYDLFWLISTRREMIKKGAKIPSVWILFLPIVALAALLIASLAMNMGNVYNTSDTAVVNQAASAMQFMFVIIGLLFVFAILPLMIYWFYKYCKAVDFVTGGRTSFDMAFWIGVLLNFVGVSFFWPGFIQDGFNKYGNSVTPSDPSSSDSAQSNPPKDSRNSYTEVPNRM